MKILNYFFIFSFLLLAACIKDKGNYDYITLPDFTLDTATYDNSYQVQQGRELLVIDPALIASDTTDYEYLWRIYQTTSIASVTPYDTLSMERRLETLIHATPGTSNTLELRITQKSTGLQKFFTFSVSTSADVPNGWMVVYEKDGYTDIDIVRYPGILGGNNADTIYRNMLLAGLGGELPAGSPVGVLANSGGVMLATRGSGVMQLQNNNFNIVRDHNELFLSGPPAVLDPTAISSGSVASAFFLYVNGGTVYWRSGTNISGSIIGAAVLTSGEPYEAAFVVTHIGSQCMFYDQISRRFLHLPQNGGILASFAAATHPQAQFDLNNIGKHLIWMAQGFPNTSGNHKYAYFRNPEGGNERYLYIFDTRQPGGNPSVALIDVTALPDILDAKFHQVSLISPNIFYATSSKLYSYVFNEATNTYSNVANPFTAPAGEEITEIKLVATGNNNTTSRRMCIATWNETTQQGKMYVYTVEPLTGIFGVEPIITTHDGKILAMERKTN